MTRFRIVRDPVLGEEVWIAANSRGLPLRVVPTDRFREAVAVVSFRYGSTDLGFEDAAGVHESPEGVAHFLEHELFEDESLGVMARFSERGARVNAMTGFAKTSYYFQATSRFDDNLADLLHLVARAHLTDQKVEKERGVIAQEIRMYEDSAEYRGFFDLLGCLYREHPVRHPVGGTVESIQRIDVAELSACHAAFYRAGNAAVAVAGPVDPERVLELAERCALPAGARARGVCPSDLDAVEAARSSRRMDVARPRLLIGFKDRTLIADPIARRRRELVTQVLLDRLFGGSSEVREALHERGLVDDSLSASYLSEATFGVAVVGCETERPNEVCDALADVMRTPPPIAEDDLERTRRKMLGRYVRSFDALQALAFAHADDALDGVEPFGVLGLVQSIRVEDVLARQRELCRRDSFGSAVLAR